MKRAAVLLIMAVVAGCPGRNAPPPDTGAGGSAPGEGQVAAGSTRPSIDVERLRSGDVPATVGLPARSDDQVAVPLVSGDGGRGNPNLTIQFLRVPDGSQVDEIVVLTADEVESSESNALLAAVEERARRAEQVLADGEFAPLELVDEAGPVAAPDSPVRLAGAGLWIGFVEGHLVVRTEAGPVLLDESIATPPAGAAPSEPPDCSGPPRLLGAWVDAGRSLVVARLIDVGPEPCGEPDDRYVVRMLGPGDATHAYAAEGYTIDCAQFGDRAYRARLVAAGIDVDGVECGERDDDAP